MRVLDQLLERSRRNYVSGVNIAGVYTALGDNDRAFEWLDKAYADHDKNWTGIVNPEFARLRSHPKGEALLRKLGLPR
jgi:hypothetical protein